MTFSSFQAIDPQVNTDDIALAVKLVFVKKTSGVPSYAFIKAYDTKYFTEYFGSGRSRQELRSFAAWELETMKPPVSLGYSLLSRDPELATEILNPAYPYTHDQIPQYLSIALDQKNLDIARRLLPWYKSRVDWDALGTDNQRLSSGKMYLSEDYIQVLSKIMSLDTQFRAHLSDLLPPNNKLGQFIAGLSVRGQWDLLAQMLAIRDMISLMTDKDWGVINSQLLKSDKEIPGGLLYALTRPLVSLKISKRVWNHLASLASQPADKALLIESAPLSLALFEKLLSNYFIMPPLMPPETVKSLVRGLAAQRLKGRLGAILSTWLNNGMTYHVTTLLGMPETASIVFDKEFQRLVRILMVDLENLPHGIRMALLKPKWFSRLKSEDRIKLLVMSFSSYRSATLPEIGLFSSGFDLLSVPRLKSDMVTAFSQQTNSAASIVTLFTTGPWRDFFSTEDWAQVVRNKMFAATPTDRAHDVMRILKNKIVGPDVTSIIMKEIDAIFEKNPWLPSDLFEEPFIGQLSTKLLLKVLQLAGKSKHHNTVAQLFKEKAVPRARVLNYPTVAWEALVSVFTNYYFGIWEREAVLQLTANVFSGQQWSSLVADLIHRSDSEIGREFAVRSILNSESIRQAHPSSFLISLGAGELTALITESLDKEWFDVASELFTLPHLEHILSPEQMEDVSKRIVQSWSVSRDARLKGLKYLGKSRLGTFGLLKHLPFGSQPPVDDANMLTIWIRILLRRVVDPVLVTNWI